MQLIHVVRRYGPVGGMERYVWELTHRLHESGHQILVLCEECLAARPQGIRVIELGSVRSRPRWLALFRFDLRVNRWLKQNPHPSWLIHSHERLSCHQVTTFHGPPFATVLDKPWWRLLSLRIWMQLYMEKRELATAQCIVANSHLIRQQLKNYYPQFLHKLSEPITPGVGNLVQRAPRIVPVDSGVIGFVGKEWKRKGLLFAVQIAARLRYLRPNLEFHVIGPVAEDIQHLFADWHGGYLLKGWQHAARYADFDVLLHPARAEPYGMVISEAMAAQVPVVVSDVCGVAAEIPANAGKVLSLNAPLDAWCEVVNDQLNRGEPVSGFKRGWDDVAQEYVEIYRKIVE